MDRLVQQLTRLAAAFPRDGVTEATLAVYADDLCRLDQATLLPILDGLTRSARHFPPLATILEEYRQARLRAAADPRFAELDIGRVPMPDHLRRQWLDTAEAFDKRSQELGS